MKIPTTKAHPFNRVSDQTDSSEIAALEKRLSETADQLAALVPDMGKAKQIIEFASDQRKRALAKAMSQWLDGGESASAAEAKGRASYVYGEELAELANQLREAETTKARWEATKCQFEACRSLLAMQRELGSL